jgi:hypothetical protein
MGLQKAFKCSTNLMTANTPSRLVSMQANNLKNITLQSPSATQDISRILRNMGAGYHIYKSSP